DDMAERVTPYLQEAGVVSTPITPEQARLLSAAMPLVHERMNKLVEAVPMLGFLFSNEVSYDEADRTALLTDEGLAIVKAARDGLAELSEWTTAAIEGSLRHSLLDTMGLKPRVAFGPVRVAITGRRISPPLFESMELLGREASLARLDAVL
ncbi:MAG TPA: glutamate--tRNA ligase, partial [Marmoricola sp.]|nr:glutamate--tRNA ligase [Marmoricola sp.]